MSGDDQIAMKRKINAQLDKLRREQRERLERQARRRAWAAGLAMLALFIALFIALCLASWRQQRLRELQDSGVAARPSCRSAQYARGDAGRPALEPVAVAPPGRGHPGGAASCAWTPGWWAETHTLAQGGSTPPRATMVTG